MLRESRIFLALLVSFFALAPAPAQTNTRDQRMINYAKSIDVSRLDPSLHGQTLDGWIRSLIGNARQEWKVEDCGTQIGVQSYDADPPICGKLYSQLADGRVLRVWIAIGSHKTGTKAPPILWLAYFGVPGQELPAAKLSYLPGLIKGVVGAQRISSP
jgi:hypothetical protein